MLRLDCYSVQRKTPLKMKKEKKRKREKEVMSVLSAGYLKQVCPVIDRTVAVSLASSPWLAFLLKQWLLAKFLKRTAQNKKQNTM